MRISVARHGGLAAGTLLGRAPDVLDADALADDERKELGRLIDAARGAPPPEPGPGRTRDGMSYTITVDEQGGRTTLKATDTSLSPAIEALLSFVDRHLRS
jgi:hypothetical protein